MPHITLTAAFMADFPPPEQQRSKPPIAFEVRGPQNISVGAEGKVELINLLSILTRLTDLSSVQLQNFEQRVRCGFVGTLDDFEISEEGIQILVGWINAPD